MSFWTFASKPKSPLGYHRVLAPTAGVKVSPLCLGGMNFGEGWEHFMGKCKKEEAFALMDAFYDMGGNFIDTANNYQEGDSERWIGEWMESRGNRDQMVIATKYTTGFRDPHSETERIQSNFVGNSVKSLKVSVNYSLKHLRTDYIDLLYVHWWDFTTGVEEVMHGLNSLVSAGKVLYLGVSDTPAWIVIKANDYARANGLRPFSVYQGLWNPLRRDMESEIVPMCRDQGMGIAPWGVLSGGKLKSAEARQLTSGGRSDGDMTEDEIRVSDILDEIAKSKNASIQAVVLAYLLHKSPYVFPIIGQRKIEHLKANVEALGIEMSKEDMDKIDTAVNFNPGFPMNFIFHGKYDLTLTAADIPLTQKAAHIDAPPQLSIILPRKEA
ncbi:NADP-dependent oxidoreductase domain-containing protein [Aspergillus granulosus]|uniref:NADP-dependent oxidoreductase domain-containing protein n=1 Tax=Aspergillus granulosus TaxID=176169 RepID=A0ABR4HED4_9EURO